jgi:hypothetical protein
MIARPDPESAGDVLNAFGATNQNTIGVEFTYSQGKYGHGITGGILVAVDRQGGLAVYAVPGAGKYAGMGKSLMVNVGISNAPSVSDLGGAGWQSGTGVEVTAKIAVESGVFGGSGYSGKYFGFGRAGGTRVTGATFGTDSILLWQGR